MNKRPAKFRMAVDSELKDDCAEILRKLIHRYNFLQLESAEFDIWDNDDAANVLADIIEEINRSSAIQEAYNSREWGK